MDEKIIIRDKLIHFLEHYFMFDYSKISENKVNEFLNSHPDWFMEQEINND